MPLPGRFARTDNTLTAIFKSKQQHSPTCYSPDSPKKQSGCPHPSAHFAEGWDSTVSSPWVLTTDHCLISPSTSPPPDQNPPASHTQSQSSPSPFDPESAPSSRALPRATAAPPLHSDPPTALRLPYSPRPAPSAHSSPAPDPPASPPTSFLPSPFVRTSRSGRYLAGATASARGCMSTFPSAAPQSRLPEALGVACNSTH